MKHIYLFCFLFLTITTSLNAQIIDIPDSAFKSRLVNTNNTVDNDGDGLLNNNADTNDDGEIDLNEALAVTMMDVGVPYGASWAEINTVEGLQYFTNLEYLNCQNNNIASLDLSPFSALETLICYNNQFTSLDLSNSSTLQTLLCAGNNLGSIDLSALSNLIDLNVGSCGLNSLDVSNNGNLEKLQYYFNTIQSINFENLSNLKELNCRGNQISTLDLSDLPNLEIFNCSQNELTSLDFSQNLNLENINCSLNQLTELNINQLSELNELSFSNNFLTTFDSNGTSLYFIEAQNNALETVNLKDGISGDYISYFLEYHIIYYFSNNPIEVMCVDDFGLEASYLSAYNTTTYCTFVPGGEYNTISGQTFFDNNDDGCDATDYVIPNLVYSISDSSSDGNVVSNNSGVYNFYVGEDTYSFSPIIENPSYFNVSPENQTVSFPSDTSHFEQDFCITPNGIFNDLEITLIPMDQARPGFDADYKLLYKNKGSTTLSGSVSMTFQDALMDLVSTVPVEDAQTGNTLEWNFSNLNPFEIGEIEFTMSINTPMDTPPVNGDDILVFEASIVSSETDETPSDNVFSLNQTVVNSFDPNDKTCLEGDTISPEQVGEYLHYRIRFENTGTANAINIVVKDNIDRNTLDLSTLVPLDSSHDFFTRTVDDGSDYYVEFIFENINLPYDDANNDGYVVFKIKTLDTLALDDLIENEAEIYFDFNFPIITNVAETTVATLSTNEVQLVESSIVVFPNPTSQSLFVKSNYSIDQVAIYDISGRLIEDIKNEDSQDTLEIDTERLSAGTYFLNIITDNNVTIKTFIKE